VTVPASAWLTAFADPAVRHGCSSLWTTSPVNVRLIAGQDLRVRLWRSKHHHFSDDAVLTR
jgi:hypothetical protein